MIVYFLKQAEAVSVGAISVPSRLSAMTFRIDVGVHLAEFKLFELVIPIRHVLVLFSVIVEFLKQAISVCAMTFSINIVHITCHLAEFKLFRLAVLIRHVLAQSGVRKFEASAPWARKGGPPPELGIVVRSTARKRLKTSVL